MNNWKIIKTMQWKEYGEFTEFSRLYEREAATPTSIIKEMLNIYGANWF